MSAFVRGARIAESPGGAGGDGADRLPIDTSALANAGLLFRDPSRRRPGNADLIGKAVVGGRRWKVRAHWDTDPAAAEGGVALRQVGLRSRGQLNRR